jgi:hypothetical protein
MDKVKEPAMVLSAINSVALVGAISYFYKQQQEARQDITKLGKTLDSVLRVLTETQKGGKEAQEEGYRTNK